MGREQHLVELVKFKRFVDTLSREEIVLLHNHVQQLLAKRARRLQARAEEFERLADCSEV